MWVLRWAVAGAILVSAIPAMAATVVLDKTDLVDGVDTMTYAFAITDAGVYRATLTDYELGGKFDFLHLHLFDQHTTYADLFSAGTFEFSAQPGSYYAYVWADASNVMNLGMYNLTIDLTSADSGTVVPLPMAGWMLLGALSVFGAVILSKLRHKGDTAPV